MNLSQSQLQRKMEIFTRNGLAAEAQAVIAGVGYTPAELTAGSTLLQTWITARTETKAQRAAQKQATNLEETARQAAEREAVNFAGTVRTLYRHDEVVLTALGLQTQYETIIDPETGEPVQQAVTPPADTASLIARWTLLFTNVSALDQSVQDALAAAAWDAARIAAALTLVQNYATADNNQQQAIQAHQAQSAVAKAAHAAALQWYRQAARLSQLAIQRADPPNAAQLRELLGFDPQ